MTELMNNIQTQAGELAQSLAYAASDGRSELERAAEIVREAQHVYITGIGSSWHAGMAVQSVFHERGRPVILMDASELLHFTRLTDRSVVIALSRSGKSVEIVKLLDRAADAGTKVIGITNTPDSPLGQRADVTLLLNAAFDHNISITMYSALTLVGGLLAEAAAGTLDDPLVTELNAAIAAAGDRVTAWSAQLEGNSWFAKDAPAYFLARGGALASCHETRLLWEEAAKVPASAMTTGGFRHGPQEILAPGLRVGLWIDAERLRDADLALAADLDAHDVSVMVIGKDVATGAPERALVLETPDAPTGWQFLVDIVPGQIASEYLARLRGVDCDSFRICPYIIETEGGLKVEANA